MNMINTDRKVLLNHTPVSFTTIDGWPSIFFSLPFIGAGLFIILMSYDIIPVNDAQFNAPRPLVASFGALFAGAGLIVLVNGIAGLLRKARNKRVLQERPGDRVLSDYKWDKTGINGNNLTKAVNSFFGWCLFVVFMIPFHWLLLSIDENIPGFVWTMIGLFDLIIFGIFIYSVYLFLRYLKYGNSRLKFHRFPYMPGEEFQTTVTLSKPIKGATAIKAILRYVVEVYEERGSSSERSQVVVCYELYSEAKDLTQLASYNRDVSQIPVSFVLPTEMSFKNNLAARPPSYWQLEVFAATPGVDFRTHFLIPVY